MDKPISVMVKFDERVPMKLRGSALMAFEAFMRDRGCKANVYLERMADDLRSRRAMTPEERAKL